MIYFVSYVSALLFGVGLGLSGMTNPENVVGFLDFFGDWRPALMFVMVGAIAVHGASFFLIKKRRSPLLTAEFMLPTKKEIDIRLVLGSALFGMGWGIAGFCPGPAVVSIVTYSEDVLLFIGAMIAGIAVYHYVVGPRLAK